MRRQPQQVDPDGSGEPDWDHGKLSALAPSAVIPTRCAGALGGDVQSHPVDAFDLVDDPGREALQHVIRKRAQSASWRRRW